jgi:hypothetical protein
MFADSYASRRDQGAPLHSAAFGGNADIIKALLAANADIGARDMYVNLSFSDSQRSCYARLVNRHRARCRYQRTPLHLATRKLDVVQALLDAGADIDATDECVCYARIISCRNCLHAKNSFNTQGPAIGFARGVFDCRKCRCHHCAFGCRR